MTTLATTASRCFGKSKTTCGIVSRPRYFKRLRFLIEHSDWDERILDHEATVNRLCIIIVIISLCCLAPSVLNILLR